MLCSNVLTVYATDSVAVTALYSQAFENTMQNMEPDSLSVSEEEKAEIAEKEVISADSGLSVSEEIQEELVMDVEDAFIVNISEDGKISYKAEGGNFYFDSEKGVITGADKTITALTVPESIKGVPVKAISNQAFHFCKS